MSAPYGNQTLADSPAHERDLCAAAGNPQGGPGATASGPVANGVQPAGSAALQNGVSANGRAADFEETVQVPPSGLPGGEPILPFEGGEPFLMKTGPMKPQHVAGAVKGHRMRL